MRAGAGAGAATIFGGEKEAMEPLQNSQTDFWRYSEAGVAGPVIVVPSHTLIFFLSVSKVLVGGVAFFFTSASGGDGPLFSVLCIVFPDDNIDNCQIPGQQIDRDLLNFN